MAASLAALGAYLAAVQAKYRLESDAKIRKPGPCRRPSLFVPSSRVPKLPRGGVTFFEGDLLRGRPSHKYSQARTLPRCLSPDPPVGLASQLPCVPSGCVRHA